MTTRRIAAGAATVALLAGASAAVPGAAQAQSADRGATTVALSASALKALKKQGVTVTAVRPAKLRGGKLTLPVARGALGTRSSWLEHDGGLTFRRRAGGKVRKVAFTDLRATLGTTTSVTASVAGTRLTLFTVTGRKPSVNRTAGTTALRPARTTLSVKAAARMRRALGLRRLPRTVGRLSMDVTLRPQTPASSPTSTTAPATLPAAPAPPVAAATARPIVQASLEWHVRDSFIRYMNAGEGTAVAQGATAGTPTVRPGTDQALVYDFGFPFTAGTHDTTTNAATIAFRRGLVNFRYVSHGIDFDAAEPEIVLNGAQSHVTMRFDGRLSTRPGNVRGILVDLHLDRAASVTHTGTTHTYTQVPGTIPQGTAGSVFANYYAPGEEFGWVTFSYTTG